MTLSLSKLLLVLDCFSPEANLIFTVVDQDGNAGVLGFIPQMNLDLLHIVYGG